MTDTWHSIDDVLFGLLRYREVLGAVVLSQDGLVVGSLGVSRTDADLVGALGASLVGAADRTARRLGAGVAGELCLNTSDGMLHVRNGGDFAVVLLTDRCDSLAAGTICQAAVEQIQGFLAVA